MQNDVEWTSELQGEKAIEARLACAGDATVIMAKGMIVPEMSEAGLQPQTCRITGRIFG